MQCYESIKASLKHAKRRCLFLLLPKSCCLKISFIYFEKNLGDKIIILLDSSSNRKCCPGWTVRAFLCVIFVVYYSAEAIRISDQGIFIQTMNTTQAALTENRWWL